MAHWWLTSRCVSIRNGMLYGMNILPWWCYIHSTCSATEKYANLQRNLLQNLSSSSFSSFNCYAKESADILCSVFFVLLLLLLTAEKNMKRTILWLKMPIGIYFSATASTDCADFRMLLPSGPSSFSSCSAPVFRVKWKGNRVFCRNPFCLPNGNEERE